MAAQGISTRIARDSAAFRALAPEWTAAAMRAGDQRFYQDFDWHWTWWSSVAESGAGSRGFQPHVVLVSDAKGPAGVLPLMVRRDRRLPTLDWMAVEVTDYCDAIVASDADPGAVMRAFQAAMESSGMAVADLRQIRPDSALARLMSAALETDPREGRAIFVDTSHRDEEQFQKGLNSELRKTMRRRTKRLGEQVEWRYVQSHDPADLRAVMEFCLAHKRGQLARDPVSLSAHRELFEPFAARIAGLASIGGARPVASAIMAGERILSAHFGFVDAQRMYYYLTAHDPEFERCSPGTLLALETIKNCCREGIQTFDFLRGDYSFKWAISRASVPLLAYRYGLTLPGRAYLPIERWAREARKRWRGNGDRPAAGATRAA